jgi:hypothetical protein
MLYAATERGVHVSFDDGDSWQSLRLNLPATAVRDLTVHGDDLVVGTHGRSFWILDDIGALRQLDAATLAEKAPAHLFKPATAWRLRRDLNTDTPLPPEEPAGQNPPDGAVVDYLVRGRVAGPVMLEILDAGGHPVRRFSSADAAPAVDPKQLAIPMYWVRPTPVLAADAGMHRFVWDLRLAPPAAARHDYPISAIPGDTPAEPLGPLVLPGEYQIRLSAGGETSTQPLTVRMDPRVATSPEDLARQFKLASAIAADLDRDEVALHFIGELRAHLREMPAAAHEGALGKAVAAFDAKAAALEAGSGAARNTAGASPGLRQLNGELSALLLLVNGADEPPTTQAEAGFAELDHSLGGLLGQWQELRRQDMAALHHQLRVAHLVPPIEME